MNEIKELEKTGIKGRVVVKRYRAGFVEKAEALIAKYGKNVFIPELEALKREYFLGLAVDQPNLVVSSSNHGRNLLCQWLASLTTYAVGITHGEIGTGSTAPANTDTDLATPTTRVATTTTSISNNVLTLQFFFSTAVLANGTYNEFGTFIAGTAVLGSGQMFNHALFSSPYVKAAGEDTTIEVEFTIT